MKSMKYGGEVLVEHLLRFEAHILDADKRINCPKCESVVMMRRFYSLKQSMYSTFVSKCC